MVRNAVRVLIVAGLVGVGWAVGHAQATAPVQQPPLHSPAPPELSAGSDFELLVSSANGETEVRCVRGCRLTWAATVIPKNGPVDILAPDLKVKGSVSQKGCIAPEWMAGNCHILGWKR
jgi:hypothetical protein